MDDFRFTTENQLATNADTMDWFSNEHFYEVFDEDAIFIEDDGSYAEVLDGKGQKWALHASGDGDFTHTFKLALTYPCHCLYRLQLCTGWDLELQTYQNIQNDKESRKLEYTTTTQLGYSWC